MQPSSNFDLINGKQLLDPRRLRESLFRATDPSKLGLLVPDTDKTVAPSTSQAVAWFALASLIEIHV